MVKRKLKKKNIAILILLIIVIILLTVVLNLPKNYNVEYTVNGYDITEKFYKNSKQYSFIADYDGVQYEYSVQNKYLNKEKLINKVTNYKSDNYTCVYFQSDKLDTVPVCYDGKKYVDYSNIQEEEFESFYSKKIISYNQFGYKNLNINTLLAKNIFVWDHKGYYYLNEKKQKEIDFLKEDSYYNALSYSNGEYLITPNYDEEYEFKTFYVINLKNGKVKTWKLEKEISYNSYYLGTYDGFIYMVDRKNKVEYKINPKKRKIEIVGTSNKNGQVMNKTWEEVSLTKLINSDYSFKVNQVYNYTVEKSKLYLTYYKSDIKTLITNNAVDKIIYAKDEEVYYLVANCLYYYSPLVGNVKLVTYSEWNFNNENQIFIY